MIKKLFNILLNPSYLVVILDSRNIIRFPDSVYLKALYKYKLGYKLNLNNPSTFNEKLQWLKLNNRNDKYTIMVDKCQVKNYAADVIGKEYIIPTIGVYNNFDDIDFDKLPNQFVMKCNHDSGTIIICKDKNKIDKQAIRKKINNAMNNNYFYCSREWPYKNVLPKIIVEKYMIDNVCSDLKDYKFFCFDGEVETILVCSERFTSDNMCESFYDKNWKLIDVSENNHRVDRNVKKPVNFELMKKLAYKLSKNIPFVRVDFYEINNMVYFGELTFFPNGGFEKFSPKDYDKYLGSLINIEEVKRNEKKKSN